MPRPLRLHHVTPTLEHVVQLRQLLIEAPPKTLEAESLAVALRLAQRAIRQRTVWLAANRGRKNAIVFRLHPKAKKGPSQAP